MDKQNFSRETELSFEKIERKKALEYYRFLRLKSRRHKRKNIKKRPIKSRSKSSRKIQKKRRTVPRKIIMVNIEEQKQEILQNLSYFCMQKRKERRFNINIGGQNCSDFTSDISKDCKAKCPEGTRCLTQCVKKNLR